MAKRKLKKNKSNKRLIWLALVVLVVGIGFAALQRYININGTASIDSTWDVRITDVSIADQTAGAYEKAEITHTDTSATFDVGFTTPGSYIMYKIDVVNAGTLNAKLDGITMNQTGSNNITYELSGMSNGDLLAIGDEKSIYVKVSYSGTESEETTKTLTANLLFTQTAELAQWQEEAINRTTYLGYFIENATSNNITVQFYEDRVCEACGDGPINIDVFDLNDNKVLSVREEITGHNESMDLDYNTVYGFYGVIPTMINGTQYDVRTQNKKMYFELQNGFVKAFANEYDDEYNIVSYATDLGNTTITLYDDSNLLKYSPAAFQHTNVTTFVIPQGFDLSKLSDLSLRGHGEITKIVNLTGQSVDWYDLMYEDYNNEHDCTFVTGTCGTTVITDVE